MNSGWENLIECNYKKKKTNKDKLYKKKKKIVVTKGVLSVSLHLRSRSVRVYSDLHNLCYLKKNSYLIFGILIISHPHMHARIQRAQGFCLNTSFPSLKKAYLRTVLFTRTAQRTENVLIALILYVKQVTSS